MKIYTITLNPAYDIHASLSDLRLCRENLATVTSRDAGGKGVNISRALTEMRVDNTAIVVVGEENAADFRASLAADEMNVLYIQKPGRIRENLTIHQSNAPETRISFQGFTLDDSVLAEIGDMIDAKENTVVTFTGSVPRGIEISSLKAFLKQLKFKGVKIVIDSKSFTLQDLFEVSPWLIKPNGEEIEAYASVNVHGFCDCLDFAEKCLEHGIENVMITLGEKGAALYCREQSYSALPPSVEAISTIGAGDSTIAGFIAAYCASKCKSECLRTAVAFGTAACLTKGTEPPRKADIEELCRKIEIKKM